jgi:hypothetical protein
MLRNIRRKLIIFIFIYFIWRGVGLWEWRYNGVWICYRYEKLLGIEEV